MSIVLNEKTPAELIEETEVFASVGGGHLGKLYPVRVKVHVKLIGHVTGLTIHGFVDL